jgi:hypothetical protein
MDDVLVLPVSDASDDLVDVSDVRIDVMDVHIDVVDVHIDVLVDDVPGSDVQLLELLLLLPLPVEEDRSPDNLRVLTPQILPVTLSDFSTRPHSAALSAITASVSSSLSGDFSCSSKPTKVTKIRSQSHKAHSLGNLVSQRAHCYLQLCFYYQVKHFLNPCITEFLRQKTSQDKYLFLTVHQKLYQCGDKLSLSVQNSPIS